MVIIAQGKYSKPRSPRQPDVQQPIPHNAPRQVMPDPIEEIPEEVAAFMRETNAEEAAAYAPKPQWQDATQVLPDNWQDATQVIREDWRTNTQKVPENWRDATQVAPGPFDRLQQPYDRPQPEEFPRPAAQSAQSWDFDQQDAPRPVVRNHMAERYSEDDDYDYDDEPAGGKDKKIIIISICAVILIALIGTIWAVTSIFGGEKVKDDGLILPNVIAAGVDLGGMTPDQAQMALYRATDDTYTAKSMVITLPDVILELKPADTGASLDVPAVVEAAFNYGRVGSNAEIQRAKDAAARGQEHVIALLPYLELDEDYIADTLKAYGESFNSEYASASYTFEGTKPELRGDLYDENAPCETLVINVGNPGRYVDIDSLYDQVLDAYSFHTFELRVEETKPEELPDAIDLDKIYSEYCSTPIDAYMDMQSFDVIPETWGYAFDLEAAKVQLANAEYGATVEIPMAYVAPEIMGDQLEEMLFRDTLGTYEAKTTDDKNRNTNIKLACQAINGKLLNPGDTFSFNDVVGKRTEAAGYKAANAFFGGEVVKEVGGGICQVSSTLYCAVLMADLDVIARQPHSSPVSYVPMGMDATVSWGGPEFKFRNDTNYPIRVDAEVSGGYVKIKLIGTDDKDYTVKVETKTTETLEPKIRYEEFSWDNAEGYEDGDVIEEGTTGYTVKTYKYKYSKESGTLIGEIVEATSTYKSKEQVVAKVEPKPTEPPTEPPTQPPTQAPTEAPTTPPTQPLTETPTQAPTHSPEASSEAAVSEQAESIPPEETPADTAG